MATNTGIAGKTRAKRGDVIRKTVGGFPAIRAVGTRAGRTKPISRNIDTARVEIEVGEAIRIAGGMYKNICTGRTLISQDNQREGERAPAARDIIRSLDAASRAELTALLDDEAAVRDGLVADWFEDRVGRRDMAECVRCVPNLRTAQGVFDATFVVGDLAYGERFIGCTPADRLRIKSINAQSVCLTGRDGRTLRVSLEEFIRLNAGDSFVPTDGK